MAIHFIGKHIICKRKKQTLIILAVVVIVFCFMQLLSLIRLNVFREKQGPDLKRGILVKVTDLEQVDLRKEEDLKSKKKSEIVHDEWRHVKPPRGVLSEDVHLYASNKNKTFSCIHSRTIISADQVNDNFCDCEDSSDEPGTSACPDSRFYCEYQIPHEDAQYVLGSRVNDGICDCCDGSDEWDGHVVPEHMRLSNDLQKKTIFQSPCRNQCRKVLHNLDEEEKLRREGNKLRTEYLKLAYQLPPAKKQRYGPDGVFYKVATQCYEFNTNEYEFTICPFTSIKQQKSPQPSVSLGRNPSWQKQKPGDYVLLMLDGDATLCPLGHSRRTVIHFFCGLKDEVTQVRENERCLYLVDFSSPAACS